VLAGIKEIKEVMAAARPAPPHRPADDRLRGRDPSSTRRSRTPLPGGSGDIVLIGATTENPSFEVNAALLSRSKVFVLHGLTQEAVERISSGRSRIASAAHDGRQ
jgi:putative ATPase